MGDDGVLTLGKPHLWQSKKWLGAEQKIGQAERDAAIAVEELIIAWLEELKP